MTKYTGNEPWEIKCHLRRCNNLATHRVTVDGEPTFCIDHFYVYVSLFQNTTDMKVIEGKMSRGQQSKRLEELEEVNKTNWR